MRYIVNIDQNILAVIAINYCIPVIFTLIFILFIINLGFVCLNNIKNKQLIYVY